MGNKLYVGNLPYSVDDSKLEEMFTQFGSVKSAKVIVDRDSNRSKGFGFVEMDSAEEANNAKENMNGNEIDGRPLKVDIAQERAPRSGGFNRGGGGGGRY